MPLFASDVELFAWSRGTSRGEVCRAKQEIWVSFVVVTTGGEATQSLCFRSPTLGVADTRPESRTGTGPGGVGGAHKRVGGKGASAEYSHPKPQL